MLLSSGPHHGHYVTIIKAEGAWKLFDDDAVETIKESDIPKYFGDSNCGSAYVLYYQAVDINLPSVGLPLPTPPRATNPVPVPASAPVASDDVQPPILPPGLTSEHDSSDLAESSGPTTPAPSNPTYSPKINNSPTHSKLNLPPHDFPPPPPIPQQSSQKAQGGLFHSLRHVPSVKIKNNSGDKKPLLEAVSMSTNSSASGSLPSPANASSPQLLNMQEVASNIPESSPVETTPISPKSNGVGKDKWYKRKSVKSKDREKAPTSSLKAPPDRRSGTVSGKLSESLAPPSPASTVGSLSQRSSSPSHPQSDVEGKGEGTAPRRSLARRPSTPGPGPPTMASASTPSFADDVPAVPPLPPLSTSPNVQAHRPPRPSPQTRPPVPYEPPRRATIVGETTGRKTTESHRHSKLNGDANHHSKQRPNSLHGGMLATNSSSSSSELLTPTLGAPLDVSTPPSADPPLSGMTTSSPPLSAMSAVSGQGGVGAGSNWKKATRKLSLTGTMLGFAKKEKHRDRLGGIT